MRIALLIGLLAASVAGAAQAQLYKPYQPPKPFSTDRDPYDLPKSQQGNPYDRDYSKPDPATNGPGYRNVDGSAPPRRNSESSNGGYGSRSSGSDASTYGSSRNRDLSRCKPGIVC